MVIAVRDLAFHQEILDFLGRQRKVEVVSSLTDPEHVRDRMPSEWSNVEAMVVCPAVGRTLAGRLDPAHPVVFLVAEEMTVPVLRTAIDVGAQGAFCWPEERADLAQAISRSRQHADRAAPTRGTVVAVLGTRGGVGVTFLASHIAAACARDGRRTVLVDLDPAFGDLAAALGFIGDGDARSMEDLIPVMDELGPEHVLRTVTGHPGGFDVLLARPSMPSEGAADASVVAPPATLPTGLFSACTALLAGDYQVVVLHLPRTLGPIARTAVRLADEAIVVADLDLMSLYGARRTLTALAPDLAETPLRIVLNATRRPEVSLAEFERVLGLKPTGRVRADRAVASAQVAGRLLGPRSRGAWRDVVTLAASVSMGAPGAAR